METHQRPLFQHLILIVSCWFRMKFRLEAFPGPVSVRTLDALHLASCDYLRNQGQSITLASYDHRMVAIARAMNIPPFDLEHH